MLSRKLKKLILGSFLLSSLNSCIYTNVKFPLDRDVWETKIGSKVGTASSHTILWLVAWGDSGTKAAAENGGLTVVNHLDMGVKMYLFGVYSRTDTIAYGD
jgi:hypothetical protein